MRVVYCDAENVSGKHIGGALEPVEFALDGSRKCMSQGGFTHPGHVFDKEMTSGQKTDQRQPDDFGFTADCLRQRCFERLQAQRHRRALFPGFHLPL